MALLPQMLQSIEVLQLATADLVAFVDAELQQNETLEVERREVEAPEQQEATSVERDERAGRGHDDLDVRHDLRARRRRVSETKPISRRRLRVPSP